MNVTFVESRSDGSEIKIGIAAEDAARDRPTTREEKSYGSASRRASPFSGNERKGEIILFATRTRSRFVSAAGAARKKSRAVRRLIARSVTRSFIFFVLVTGLTSRAGGDASRAGLRA